MAVDSRVQTFLDRNEEATKSHEPIPLLKDSLFKNGPHPDGNIVIVSCFDARVEPLKYFGLKPGEANILNNAAGRIDEGAIRSLCMLDCMAGVGTVIVVHHTDCGATHSSDAEIRRKLKERAPDSAAELDGMGFGSIEDMRQSVVDDILLLRSKPYFKHFTVLGYVYDITSGKVEEVTV